nr:hypothetical protein [Oscillospiraceae bacterium]
MFERLKSLLHIGPRYRSLGRIHCIVPVKEGDEILRLRVDADPNLLVTRISEAVKMMQTLSAESTQEQEHDVALYFATVLFGKEQAGKLLDLYNGSGQSVLYMCSVIVEKDISARIIKAQKHAR